MYISELKVGAKIKLSGPDSWGNPIDRYAIVTEIKASEVYIDVFQKDGTFYNHNLITKSNLDRWEFA